MASEIMIRFMERGMLEKYDPEMLHDVTALPGRPAKAILPGPRYRTARFSSYLRRFTFLSTLQHRDRLAARARREALILDADSARVVDAHPDPADRLAAGLDAASVIRKAMPSIRAERSPTGRWELEEALVACVHSVEVCGSVRRSLVAQELGISSAAAATVIGRLRERLLEAGAGELELGIAGRTDTAS